MALDVSGDSRVLATTYGQLEPPLGIHRLKVCGLAWPMNSDVLRS